VPDRASTRRLRDCKWLDGVQFSSELVALKFDLVAALQV
jgi:hypothetical protein